MTRWLVFLVGVLVFWSVSASATTIVLTKIDTTIPIPLPPVIREPEEEKKGDFFRKPRTIIPRFPGCEAMDGSHEDKKQCANQKMLHYIYSHLRYPPAARAADIEGIAVVGFSITTEGRISAIEVLSNPGKGLGEEAARFIASMNDLPVRWTPGEEGGRFVEVRYNFPIRFKLN